MKKIILSIALIAIISNSNAQSRHRKEHYGTETKIGLGLGIAGAAFILAGALETPERQWTPSSTPTQIRNSYNQSGSWGWQPFYQNPNRMACLITGLTLAICSISIKF